MKATSKNGSLRKPTSNVRSPSSLGEVVPLSLNRANCDFADMEPKALAPAIKSDFSTVVLRVTAILSLFALAFLFPAWPWLSGTVTIPWDAKSQFLPPLQSLANVRSSGTNIVDDDSAPPRDNESRVRRTRPESSASRST